MKIGFIVRLFKRDTTPGLPRSLKPTTTAGFDCIVFCALLCEECAQKDEQMWIPVFRLLTVSALVFRVLCFVMCWLFSAPPLHSHPKLSALLLMLLWIAPWGYRRQLHQPVEQLQFVLINYTLVYAAVLYSGDAMWRRPHTYVILMHAIGSLFLWMLLFVCCRWGSAVD